MDLFNLSAHKIVEKIKNKEVSAVFVAQTFLEKAKKINEKLNAYICFNEDLLKEAKKIDEKISQKKTLGKLAGLPIGVKDMILTEKIPTTAASLMLKDFIPSYSASLIEKIKKEDGLILGKCNQDEFAMGSSNKNSYFGNCKNPWNLDYVPGGSSGGSAASTAAYMSPLSLGTDTGGSVRQPAHFCGVFGLKPTYGRISRYGVIAFASSLDQVGLLSRNIKDLAVFLESVSGFDPSDGTSSKKPVLSWSSELNQKFKPMKIAMIEELNQNLSPEVKKAMDETKKALIKKGCKIDQVSIKYLKESIAIYYLIATAEASSNLARYDGVRFGHRSKKDSFKDLFDFYSENRGEAFGSEVKRRILTGSFVLSKGYYDEYYFKAVKIRNLMKEEIRNVFKDYDCLLTPVNKGPAVPIKKEYENILDVYLSDLCTVFVNLCGLPALSLPTFCNEKKLPVGVQLVAPSFKEENLFHLGKVLEDHFEFEKELKNVMGSMYWS